jgi:hypothetical protein
MPSKRFLVTLGVLTISLCALVSGVDAALDHFGRSPAQSSFVIYDEQGRTLFAFNGDLNDCNVSLKPASSFAVPRFLHRT